MDDEDCQERDDETESQGVETTEGVKSGFGRVANAKKKSKFDREREQMVVEVIREVITNL